jgi:hypothetical protein
MFWKLGISKRRTAAWQSGLVGLAVWGLIMSGGMALNGAWAVVLDGGDGVVIPVTTNHPPNEPGNYDNQAEPFNYGPSFKLTSVHKTLTPVRGFNDRRTAVANHDFSHPISPRHYYLHRQGRSKYLGSLCSLEGKNCA